MAPDVVLTAGHVFDEPGNTTVRFRELRVPAKLIAVDRRLDIAAVRIQPVSIKPLPIAIKDPLVATNVEVWGFGPRVFRAFNAVVVQPIRYKGDEGLIALFGDHGQVTVGGDSGGPVVSNGQLVGVHWGYRENDNRCRIHAVGCEAVRKFLQKALK